MVSYYRQDFHMQGKTVYSLFIALARMVTLRMKVVACFRFGR